MPRLFFAPIIVILSLCLRVGGVGAQTSPPDRTLFTFDSSTEGWQLVPSMIAGEFGVVATTGATCHSAALEVEYPGLGAWRTTSLYYNLSAAQSNLSIFTTYSVDIFIDADLEGSTDFIAQLYTKTDSNWRWTQASDQPIPVGVWTTVTTDLSTLGNIAETHEIGIKIGSTVTAFTGTIYIDNIRFSADPGLNIAPFEFNFETDLQGWQLNPEDVGRALNYSSLAGSGCSALKVAGTFLGTGSREEIQAFVTMPPEQQDFSAYSALLVEVYVPENALGFTAQLNLMTNNDPNPQGGGDVRLLPGTWTTLQINLSALNGTNQVQNLWLRIGAALTAPLNVDLLIDNVRLSGSRQATPTLAPTAIPTIVPTILPSILTPTPLATTPPDGEVHTLYDFEAGIQPWELASPDQWTGGDSVGQGSVDTSSGMCLQLGVNYPGVSFVDAGAKAVISNEGVDWSAYTELAFDIFVPPGLENSGAKLYIKHGRDWTWAESEFIELHGSGWVSVSTYLRNMQPYPPPDTPVEPDLTQIHEVGLKIGTSSAFSGVICIDNVRLIRGDIPTPTPTPALASCPTGQTVLVTPNGTENVNVRSGPSESNSQVGTLLPGQYAEVYAWDQTRQWFLLNPDNNWWVASWVVMVQGTADALPVLPAETSTQGTMWLYTFNTDFRPWYLAQPDQWTAGVDISQGTTPDNRSSLLLSVNYSGSAYQDAGAAVVIADTGVDWSLCTYLALDVYIPSQLAQGGASLYLKYGNDWTYVQQNYLSFNGASGWIPIVVAMRNMLPYPTQPIPPDLTNVREIGVKIGASVPYRGFIAIDNVRLLR